MIPNFIVFSSLHCLKVIKPRQAVAIKTKTWNPQIRQSRCERTTRGRLALTWTPRSWMLQERWEVMGCKCAQPSNTNAVRNAQDSLDGDPHGRRGSWKGSETMTCAQASLWGELIFLSFPLPHILWPDFYSILIVGQETTKSSPCVNRGCLHT